MKVYQHTCIKPTCTNTYQSIDPDAYYCEGCDKQRKEFAKEVDAKHKTTGRETKSTWQMLDETGSLQVDGGMITSRNPYAKQKTN